MIGYERNFDLYVFVFFIQRIHKQQIDEIFCFVLIDFDILI